MTMEQRGQRFYRTGDYVFIDADGVAHFRGRVDRQVKVNGYRVELEHIENVLRRVDGVREAAVFLLEVQGKPRLVAAIQTAPGLPSAGDSLRSWLETLLPAYMIPRTFVEVAEFPRNDNGKTNLKVLRELVLERLEPAEQAQAGEADRSGPARLAHELRELWKQQLRAASFDDEQSFFDLGGDSLDAIQVIAELQLRGYPITAHAFLKQPTIAGLLRAIEHPATSAAPAAPVVTARESRALSPAQAYFFRQHLAQRELYNQAVLFECELKVDVDVLSDALRELLTAHPSLRTAYEQDDEGAVAIAIYARDHRPSVSHIAADASEAELEAEIERAAQRAHESMSLLRGRLFRAHVFKRVGGKDQLLLVAHHLAVDVISWRIIVADLVRLYCERAAGQAATLPPGRATFWGWVEHVEAHRAQLFADSEPWLSEVRARAAHSPVPVDEYNTEGSSRTVWLGFSRADTQRMQRELVSQFGTPLHLIVLGTFAYWHAQARGARSVSVDVESHGRVTFDDSVDIARVVGWHTSTFPVAIEVSEHGLTDLVAGLGRTIGSIAHLGAAFGVAESCARGEAWPASAICYNYLGEIHFGHDARFPLRRSPYAPGRARGERNHRHYELKLTARIVDEHLVLDLSFPGSADVEEHVGVMRNVSAALLTLAGLEPAAAGLALEDGTRTGLLTYVPRRLVEDEKRSPVRAYRAVLVTGCTGYVGVHALRELLVQSSAHAYCLVRAKQGEAPLERLRLCFDAYFPGEPLATFAERITILEGDVAAEHLGLRPPVYEHLCAAIDAIYHFAAETKLFGHEQEFVRNNVVPVQTCVALARHTRPKDLHYMSTLAVSGVNPQAAPVDFSEDSTDIGQEFQNYYESTKYAAETVVRGAQAWGCRVFIYRSGNVSGHSRTGKFQLNCRDNRFVQFLVACVKLGKLPRDLGAPIVLSPVDEVASGIVAISLDASLEGGVFHVDSSFEVQLEQVFRALRDQGFAFASSGQACFNSLFSEARGRQDADVALGQFWAARKPRNVRYVNERTQRVLDRLGRPFTRLDQTWVAQFIAALVASGAFEAPSRTRLVSTPSALTAGEQSL